MMNWLRQLFCRHRTGRILHISFDGATVYECHNCKKIVERPL